MRKLLFVSNALARSKKGEQAILFARCAHSGFDRGHGFAAPDKADSKLSRSTKRRAKLSKSYLPTMKDNPAFAAESESHTLMLRAGLIRQSSAGIHSLLPFGLRSLQKLERIIDEEMEGVGAHKVVLPNLLASEGWQKTGRWEQYGQELFRLKDRKGSAFLLAPTHEEEITQLVAADVVSTRQLPVRLYQLGKKFRDEARPRAGLLRGKEFVMKDLYTFDANEADALETYDDVNRAYRRIFSRIGLPFAVAEADTGNIGGTRSHEYHFVSDAGEDRLLSCGSCGYTANEERARSKSSHEPQVDAPAEMVEIAHAAAASNKTLEPATEFYSGRNFSAQLVLEGKTHVVVVGKAHRKISDIKVGKLVVQASQAANGGSLAIILDTAVAESMPAAAKTLASSLGSSVPILVEDVLVAEAGDLCPTCTDGSQLQKLQGIEVGHAFHLGQRYSLPLAAAYKALDGSRQVMVPFSMGCFGIGVSRILGAVVQISHDKDGIIWPESLAPYKVCIIPTFNTKRREVEEQPVVEAAERMYDELEKAHPSRYAGEVVIDDRWDMTFGQRIREAMLVGYPYVVVLGQGYLRNGAADLITRCNNNKQQMAATEAASFLVQMP